MDKGFSALAFQVTGTVHTGQGVPCEDAVLCRDSGKTSFYGIADGQSGKRHCLLGAEKSLAAVCEYIMQRGIDRLSSYAYVDEIRYELIRAVRDCIEKCAAEYASEREEFSSTLNVIVIDRESGEYMTVHLGDGCIVGILENGELRMMSAPDNGITARYTWLTTSADALMHMNVTFGNVSEYNRLLLMSDGAECLCRGRNISRRAQCVMEEYSPDEIIGFVMNSKPRDDASCIIVE